MFAVFQRQCALPGGAALAARRRYIEHRRARGAQPEITTPGRGAAAERCFHNAIAAAREQGTKSFELRAATSLANLWQQQGRLDDAHRLLGDIYGWFTEGFDTADLRRAKALLDELQSDAAS